MGIEQCGDVEVGIATEKDIPGLVECSSALFEEDAGTRDQAINTSWPREHGPNRFSTGLNDSSRLMLAARHQGRVAGYLTGTLAPPSAMTTVTTATLTAMWVHPDIRNAGTGSRLVEQFLAWAREQGAERAEVTAYVANTSARRFYARHGFADHSLTAVRTL
ncbi:GNAT family N-acetyltransferase [Streptomyces sp. O3]